MTETKLPRSREELLAIVNRKVDEKKLNSNGYWVGMGQLEPIRDIRDVFGGWLTPEQLEVINSEVRYQYMTVEEAHILMLWTDFPYDRLQFLRHQSLKERLFHEIVYGGMSPADALEELKAKTIEGRGRTCLSGPIAVEMQ